jgi:nucleotide-binding universal stress UspA family protein
MPPTLPGRASACLDKALSTAAGLGMPNAARLVLSGDAAKALCDAARTQGADLVVVGRRKPGLLGRLLGTADAEPSTRGCGFSVLSVG